MAVLSVLRNNAAEPPHSVIISIKDIITIGLKAISAFIEEHPLISGGVLIAWSYYPYAPLHIFMIPLRILRWAGVGILRILGFGRTIPRGSFAAEYERLYGGYIPEDSTFARLQSYGALAANEDEIEREEQGLFSGIIGWGLWIVGLKILVDHIFKSRD